MADILGLLADAITGGVDWMRDPRRTQQMQGIGGLLADTLASASRHKGLMGQEAAYTQQALKSGQIADALRGGPAGAQLDKAVADAYNPAGITVYHGSPFRFTKFDASKIGTGQGSQAYGNGLYLAENPAVASEYIIGSRNFGFGNWDSPMVIADKAFARAKGDVNEALKILSQEAEKTSGQSKKLNFKVAQGILGRGDQKASMYKVDLSDEAIPKFMNWDDPISGQSAEIQSLAQRLNLSGDDLGGDLLARVGKSRAGSEVMRGAGIPGIRYLDGNSRNAGQGTSNFVVFPGEEDLLRILSVNGGLLTP